MGMQKLTQFLLFTTIRMFTHIFQMGNYLNCNHRTYIHLTDIKNMLLLSYPCVPVNEVCSVSFSKPSLAQHLPCISSSMEC